MTGTGPNPAISPCGFIVDMIRQPYVAPCRFFIDSALTTNVHWYPVPSDRPIIPYEQFVASPQWDHDNGPASGMYMGHYVTEQGIQWVETMGGAARVPRLEQRFTGHFCGSESQWGGNLRTDRRRDFGHPDCCSPDNVALYMDVSEVILTSSPAGAAEIVSAVSHLPTAELFPSSEEVLGGTVYTSGLAIRSVVAREAGLATLAISTHTAACNMVAKPVEEGALAVSADVSAYGSLATSAVPLAPSDPVKRAYQVVPSDPVKRAVQLTPADPTKRALFIESFGLAISATTPSPAPTPGTSCSGAGAIAIGETGAGTVTDSLNSDWWVYHATSGVTWKITVTKTSGPLDWYTNWREGSCPFPSIVHAQIFDGCYSETPGGDMDVFVQVNGGISGSVSYTITVGSGSC